MAISSKEWLLTFLGIVGGTLLVLILKYFGLMISEEFVTMIGWGILIIIIIVFIVYKKINEVSKELEEQNKIQGNLQKDLERAKELIDIKAENKYLKDEILKLKEVINPKDGNKKRFF